MTRSTRGRRSAMHLHPFDAACAESLMRPDSYNPGSLVDLEPGVRFFVKAIEFWGGKTLWSCEGHPGGWYIVFTGPDSLARHIARLGYLRVEVNTEENSYALRLPEKAIIGTRAVKGSSTAIAVVTGEWTHGRKLDFLRKVAESWTRRLP